MAQSDAKVSGIVSIPSDSKFVGNSMDMDDWTKATVWADGEIEVEDDVEITSTEIATGTAPAVTSGGLDDKNEKVEGWTKYNLER